MICSPSCRSTSTARLLVSAPVGQLTMHSPQPTQLDVPIGRSVSKTMLVSVPLPPRPITKFCLTSLQARMQRSQRMHAAWSTLMIGDESSPPRAWERGANRD